MKMAIVKNSRGGSKRAPDIWISQGVSPSPLGALLRMNKLTQREENRDGREGWGFEEGKQRTSQDKNLYSAEQVGSRGKRLDS